MKVLDQDVVCVNAAAAEDRIVPKDRDRGVLGLLEDREGALRCKPGVSEVAPWLLVCGAPVLNPELMTALGVTCVLSAAPELPDTPLPPGVVFRRVSVHDSPKEDLTPHLDVAADIIEQERLSGGRVLVHCVAGVSRSPSLCLAYLIKHSRIPLSTAFAHLRSRRPSVRPNSGFFRQLIEFERRELGDSSVSMVSNPAAGGDIPDVYEPDYQHMLWFQQNYSNRTFGRH